jgi:osmotically-inducible protein OsmY
MKKMTMFMVSVGTATLVAGCAHEERATRYETTSTGPAYSESGSPTTYETKTVVNAPAPTVYESKTVVKAPADTTIVTTPQPGDTVVRTTPEATILTSPAPPVRSEITYADVTPNIVSPAPPPAPRSSSIAAVTDYSTTTTIISPADSALAAQVRQAINSDPNLISIAPDIHVTADKGTVTLSGSVPNEDQKVRIESLAKGTSGVVTVNNQLQIPLQPTGRAPQSGLIYSNAPSAATAGADAVSSAPIYSSSSVPNANSTPPNPPPAAVSAALDAATTNSNPNPQDSSIVSSSSTSATSTNAGLGSTEQKDLTPTSDRGTTNRVYATNRPSSAPSQTAGSADASQTVDVRGATDADKQIGAQMVQQLQNDPSTASLMPSLGLSIDNGKATLRGTVKSDEEKNNIEAVAKQVPGVTSVDNQLRVGANAASQINESK